MEANLAIRRGRVCKRIRIRELAASHVIERLQSLRMLKQRATWMRENSFDRIDVIAEMHKEICRCLHADFDPEHFCTGLYNPRQPPTPKEFTLDMTVEVENLRLELYGSHCCRNYCHGNHQRNHRSSCVLFLG